MLSPESETRKGRAAPVALVNRTPGYPASAHRWPALVIRRASGFSPVAGDRSGPAASRSWVALQAAVSPDAGIPNGECPLQPVARTTTTAAPASPDLTRRAYDLRRP